MGLNIDDDKFEADVKGREGLRLKMYLDPLGIPTIGWGHNLRDKPISRRAAQVIFEDDRADAKRDLLQLLPWVTQLDSVRQAALLDMMFNMGATTLRQFNVEPDGSLPRIRRGEYLQAGLQLRQSRWYRQVGYRGERIVRMIETGQHPTE